MFSHFSKLFNVLRDSTDINFLKDTVVKQSLM